MTIEVGILLALIVAVIGVATFYIGRQTAAKNSGQEWGEFTAGIKSDLTYIKEDIKEIKSDMKADRKEHSEVRDDVIVIKRDLKTAFNRIDELKK